jgi:hypothetical protein
MASRDLTDRVEVLEQKVTALEELPARMSALETQIVQLRGEMKGEFSAVRQEMRSLGESLRGEMRTMNDQTLAQMRMLHEEVIDRIGKLDEGRRSSRKRR